ncbi:HAMP domain-containing sensor histidine kinase [Bacteriovorax sp. DB6_IX]|uniref:sensor histidine kinase n=1 Tax=Bacteriovorax sp. DB6_IX TaxID=1353530 RepID=UPI000389E776|nr:sensor histidine kinase [Bacteriovorax sp. DB6_IX]EQC50442.1 GHKL domain protein [Bacteriovorax sp. DB6_IX]
MEQAIKLSFVTTFALSLLNLIIYFVLKRIWKKELLETMTLYWFSVVILFLIQTPLQSSVDNLIIALAFSLNVVPAAIIAKIYQNSFDEKFNYTKYLLAQIAVMLTAIIMKNNGFSFTQFCIPIVVGVLYPVIDSIRAYIKNFQKATPIHGILIFVFIYSIVTTFNFAFNRLSTDPTVIWWGWVTGSFTYILFSSFLPFFVLQEIFRVEEKKLTGIIENKTKDLTTLNSILSHDISNALQVIDLSVMRVIKTEEMRHLTKTKNKINETLALLRFVRTYFKNKDRPVPITQIHFENTLIQSADSLKEMADEKNVSIKVTSELPPGVEVLFDENLFKTCIVGNILKNAIKFSHSGETIEIKAMKDNNNRILLRIKDSGVGMSEDQLASVFTKEGKSTFGTRGEIGTGLGLPIVKELMEDHGGNIAISSEVNKGTEVILTF